MIERKSGQEVGKLMEDSSCCSRCFCCPCARPLKSNIEFFGRTGYQMSKEWNCGYSYFCFANCCCRPDAHVLKNGTAIGYIHVPCLPECCCTTI